MSAFRSHVARKLYTATTIVLLLSLMPSPALPMPAQAVHGSSPYVQAGVRAPARPRHHPPAALQPQEPTPTATPAPTLTETPMPTETPLPAPTWSYTRTVAVYNPGTTTLTDYQVRFDVAHEPGMNADFSDVRFKAAPAGDFLPYWTESYTASTRAVMWVKVPDLPAGAVTEIVMVYGNPAAADESDGEAVFEFFDSFDGANGSALSSAKWKSDAVNTVTASIWENKYRITDGTRTWIYRSGDTGSQEQANFALPENFVVEWESTISDTADNEMGQGGIALVNSSNQIEAYLGHSDWWGYYLTPRIDWICASTTSNNEPATSGEVRDFSIVRSGSLVKFYVDGTLKATGTMVSSPSRLVIAVGAYSGYPYLNYIDLDDLRVRKYVDPEPIVSFRPPEAAFNTYHEDLEATPADIEHPLSTYDILHFRDLSTDDGNIVSWSWDFDYNGVTWTEDSTEQHPFHEFETAGIYNVCLKVTDNAHQESAPYCRTLTVVDGDSLWTHSADILIDNTAGSELEDYQVEIELTTDANGSGLYIPGEEFPARGALRFRGADGTGGTANLIYSVEEWIDGVHGKVLVKTRHIPAHGQTVVTVYYAYAGGRPDVSESDGYYVLSFEPVPIGVYPDFSGWSNPATTACGTWRMMGGYGVFGAGASTQKTLSNLAAGTYTVTFTFYKIDSWDGESGRFFWNGVQQWSKAGSAGMGSQVCGSMNSNWNEDEWNETVVVNHTGGDAVLRFDSTLNQGATDESWGVNNITINPGRKRAAPGPVVFVPGTVPVRLQVLLPGERPAPGTPSGQTGSPQPIVAGVPFTVTIWAMDDRWNLVPTVTDTVQLTSTDGLAVFPPSIELQGGMALVTATFKTAGSHTIGVADLSNPAIAGDVSSPFVVQSSPAVVSLTLALPPTRGVFVPADATVVAYDIYGNVASGYTGTVRFTSSDESATLPVTYTFTTGTGKDNGVRTFANGVTFRTAGPQWVRVEDVASPALVATATVEVLSDVVIDRNVTWNEDVIIPGSLVVTNSATLTLVGARAITATNIVIAEGAAISADGQGYGSASGPGRGQDNPTWWEGGGGGAGYGGYGGNGGDNKGGEGPGGSPYGNVYQPRDLGSGGGRNFGQSLAGGAGGGAIHLVVNDALVVNGVLSANGAAGAGGSGWNESAGGGSGGSIWIEAKVISGTGTIRANGGNGGNGKWPGGGGAGGRIAIYAITRTHSITVEARGGSGYQSGGPGTIYLKGATGRGTLLVDNGGRNSLSAGLTAGAYQFDEMRLSGYGHLVIISATSTLTLTNATLTGDGTARLIVEGWLIAPEDWVVSGVVLVVRGDLMGPRAITTTGNAGLELHAHTPWRSGVYTFTRVTVGAGTTLRLLPYNNGNSDYTDDYGVELRVENLIIASGAVLSADGQGYGSASGPGRGQDNPTWWEGGGGGAGYGGYGGNGGDNKGGEGPGGSPYGNVYQPRDLGSGGGRNFGQSLAGGAGGGAIHLVVNDALVVNGVLSANGAAGAGGSGWNESAGGGSGGSIWIEAKVISGTGTIRANGGNGGNGKWPGGGGGGGRIAIYAETYAFSGTIQVNGGDGYQPGGRGTIYLNAVDPLSSTVVAAPDTGLVADGQTASTITVTLLTAEGYPVPGKPVSLEVTAGTGALINGQPAGLGTRRPIGASDISGTLTATLAATRTGNVILTAWAEEVRLLNPVTVTFTAGPPDAGRSRVSANPTQVAADGVATATVSVRVYDGHDNPVPGVPVTLSATGVGVALTQPAQPTGADGRTWGAVSSAVPEVVTVTATANGVPIAEAAQVTFVGADLAVTKSGPGEVLAGTVLTYTIRVWNHGQLPAEGVVVTDTLPEQVTYVTHTAPFPFTPPSQGSLVWHLGALNAGESVQFQVQALVAPEAGGSQVTNYIVATTETAGDAPEDNTATWTTRVARPTPRLVISPVAPTLSVRRESTATLMVTVSNVGTAVLTNVHALEPPHIPWVTLNRTEFPDLEPGQSVTFTISAEPPQDIVTGEYRDRVWIGGAGVRSQWIALTVRLLDDTRNVRLTVSNTENNLVSGALVQVQRQEPSVQVTEGVTTTYYRYARGISDATGTVFFADLEVGAYDYLAEAADHDAVMGTLTVVPGAGEQSGAIVLPGLPRLILEPASLTMTVARGQEAFREIYVRNAGVAPLHSVMITTPRSMPWVRFGLPGNTGVISAGAQVPLLVYVSPTLSDSIGLYQDYIYAHSTDGGTAALALGVEVTDHQTRTVAFQVSDMLTETLKGADVVLTRQEPTYLVTQGVTQVLSTTLAARTDARGIATFEGLPLGTYNYQVSAASHEMANGTILVEDGPAPLTISVRLAYYPFEYEWTVVPTTITDMYSVTLKLTYDTRSPGPTLYIWGDGLERPCRWEGDQVYNTFHLANPVAISQTVVSIAGMPVNYTLGPLGTGNVSVGPLEAQCGMNTPTAVITYLRAVAGPTYTFNPSSFTSLPLTPTQTLGRVYVLEVVNEFDGVILDVGKPAILNWITLTNPYAGEPLYALTGAQLPLTLTATAPAWLAEGTYTDTIPIRLRSVSGTKESYLHIVAIQTGEGLRLHTTFNPGSLLYEEATYTVSAPFSVNCPCPNDNSSGGWTISGSSGGILFFRLGPYGLPSGLPWKVPEPAIGYSHQQVRLEINQDVLLEREAFLATLTLTNTVGQSLDNMQVTIVISNAQGVTVTGHFAITPTTPTVLGDIGPGGGKQVRWTVVPGDLGITDANGEKFYVSAVMSYTLGGAPRIVQTLAREITVKPTPKLVLDYYVPGPDLTCTRLPLYVKVRNVGHGWARNLRITSAQPRIVDDPSGLLIDFEIVEAALDNQPVPNGSLTIRFGDLAPGEEKVGSWLLRTNRPGNFVEFSSDFKHVNVLGVPLSPLIEEINTHIVNPGLTNYERLNRNQASIFLAAQTAAQAGRGISTFSGYYSENAQDFSIPTRGLPLKFERSYNSAASAEKGPLGYGWAHNYEMRLELGPGDNATLVSQRGAHMNFTALGDGRFLPAPGVRADLAKGSDGVYTLTLVNQVRYTFGPTGTLLAEIDNNGNRNTMVYDGTRLVAVRAPDGRELRFAYDGQGRLVSASDPLSRTVRFGYDAVGNLAVITDVRGYTTSLTYDDKHRLTRIVDANGHTIVANEYDERGRVTRQLDGLNYATQFRYEFEDCTLGRTTTITNARGFARVDVYAPRGELSCQRDALGHVISYTYDLNFNVASITDKNGHTMYYVSDERGNPLQVTDPLSNVTRSTYDAHYNLLSQVDALGRVTLYEYDEHDNLITTTNPLSGTVVNTYDEHGQLVRTVDQNGHATWYGYDEYGNRTVVTDALGNATYTAYDLVGRPITVTGPLGRVTVYSYDEAGHILSVIDAEGNTTTYTYDRVGNLIQTTDPKSQITQYEYNALNRVTVITDALGNPTRYAYDETGNQISITDARGYTTRYEYDALDRLITATNPLSGTTIYTYDAVGNRTGVTDALGRTTWTAYDALNRPIQVTDPLSGTTVIAYDAVGNRIRVTDAKGRTTYYEYDALNRVTVMTNALGYTMTFAYDGVGNCTVMTDARGFTTRFAYDALNRLITTTDALEGTTINVYDEAGNLIQVQNTRGFTTTFGYDRLGRVITTTDALGSTVIRAYDAFSNVIQIRDTRGYTTAYTYRCYCLSSDWSRRHVTQGQA